MVITESIDLIGLITYTSEYKKLHSLQSLVRTTRRTKIANITKDDIVFWTIIRFQYGGPLLFLISKNVQILTIRMFCTRNLHVYKISSR